MSSQSEILLTQISTLHKIDDGNPNFTGVVHVQSKDSKNFLVCYPSKDDLDEGRFNFQQSSEGYVSISIKSPGIGLIALQSASNEPVNVRIWSDAMSVPQIATPSVLQSSESSSSIETDNKSSAMLIWALVILVVIFVVRNNKTSNSYQSF